MLTKHLSFKWCVILKMKSRKVRFNIPRSRNEIVLREMVLWCPLASMRNFQDEWILSSTRYTYCIFHFSQIRRAHSFVCISFGSFDRAYWMICIYGDYLRLCILCVGRIGVIWQWNNASWIGFIWRIGVMLLFWAPARSDHKLRGTKMKNNGYHNSWFSSLRHAPLDPSVCPTDLRFCWKNSNRARFMGLVRKRGNALTVSNRKGIESSLRAIWSMLSSPFCVRRCPRACSQSSGTSERKIVALAKKKIKYSCTFSPPPRTKVSTLNRYQNEVPGRS